LEQTSQALVMQLKVVMENQNTDKAKTLLIEKRRKRRPIAVQ